MTNIYTFTNRHMSVRKHKRTTSIHIHLEITLFNVSTHYMLAFLSCDCSLTKPSNFKKPIGSRVTEGEGESERERERGKSKGGGCGG